MVDSGTLPIPDLPLEVELKFALPAKDLPRLLRHELLAGARPRRQLIASTYFDTPDLALRDRALSLRIRKNGRHYVQTLKANTPAVPVPVERQEWQSPLTRAKPDLSLPELQERLGDIDPRQLQPVFVSRIRRSTRVLHPDPATTVELSCDRGEIETPAGARLPVCELELELKRGESDALFELARALNRKLPLQLETLSKAARGYALLSGDDAEAARRQMRLLVAPETPTQEAFAAIAENGLRHMLANDRAARQGDVEGVHQMRVALRRLRATLKLFKAIIPEERRSYATGETKWIAATLGPARNWDVFAGYLAPVAAAFPGNAGLGALAQATAQQQEIAHAAVRDTVGSGRYTDFVLQMLDWLSRPQRHEAAAEASLLTTTPIRQLAAALLERRYRKARKLARKFGELGAERRHKFRIALKELRYAVDALAGLYDRKAVRQQSRRLAALQDDLGLLNDIAGMHRLLSELVPAEDAAGIGEAAATLRGWYGRVAAECETKLARRVSRFLKAKRFWRQAEAA
ncbi:MAG TPA: CHAD domain-containing protein [Stellaceae bacterium]|nr:CHAD domain-containing protein [Stellaceae bacterium]